MAEIVGEHLAGLYVCQLAEPVQLSPDVGAVHGGAGSGDEDGTGGHLAAAAIGLQQASELGGEKDEALLSLAIYHSPAGLQRLHRDKRELRNSDAGGGQGLNQAEQALIAVGAGRL